MNNDARVLLLAGAVTFATVAAVAHRMILIREYKVCVYWQHTLYRFIVVCFCRSCFWLPLFIVIGLILLRVKTSRI